MACEYPAPPARPWPGLRYLVKALLLLGWIVLGFVDPWLMIAAFFAFLAVPGLEALLVACNLLVRDYDRSVRLPCLPASAAPVAGELRE